MIQNDIIIQTQGSTSNGVKTSGVGVNGVKTGGVGVNVQLPTPLHQTLQYGHQAL